MQQKRFKHYALFPFLLAHFLCNFKILHVRKTRIRTPHILRLSSIRNKNLSLKLMIFRFFNFPWHLFLVSLFKLCLPLHFYSDEFRKQRITFDFRVLSCSVVPFMLKCVHFRRSNRIILSPTTCAAYYYYYDSERSRIIKYFPLFYTILFRKCIYILFGYLVVCAVHCNAYNSFPFVMSTHKRRKFVEIFIKLVFTFAIH